MRDIYGWKYVLYGYGDTQISSLSLIGWSRSIVAAHNFITYYSHRHALQTASTSCTVAYVSRQRAWKWPICQNVSIGSPFCRFGGYLNMWLWSGWRFRYGEVAIPILRTFSSHWLLGSFWGMQVCLWSRLQVRIPHMSDYEMVYGWEKAQKWLFVCLPRG